VLVVAVRMEKGWGSAVKARSWARGCRVRVDKGNGSEGMRVRRVGIRERTGSV
jgi:hypothetical protein